MKILLIGNHSCVNRGDAAIARGLLNTLHELMPQAEIAMLSRFPVSASYLLGFPCRQDMMYLHYQQQPKGALSRLRRVLRSRLTTRLMAAAVKRPEFFCRLLPSAVREEIQYIRQFDLVLQVGGSNIVALYGQVQLDYPLLTLIAKRPLVLLGQSVGPFGTGLFKRLCKIVFQQADVVQLRESRSAALMQAAALPSEKVQLSTDLAWLVDIPRQHPVTLQLPAGKPWVAMTLRNLAPFDQLLNITQADYLAAFAQMTEALIQAGYRVLLISTCTGMDRYQNDDRMQALQLHQMLQYRADVLVEMRELNDIELGQLLAQCELLIGTRLHSAIIAMNAGCPAIALNYEHKSAGMMQDMGFADRGIDLAQLLDGQLKAKVFQLLSTASEERRASMTQAVRQQKQLARVQLQHALARWSD